MSSDVDDAWLETKTSLNEKQSEICLHSLHNCVSALSKVGIMDFISIIEKSAENASN